MRRNLGFAKPRVLAVMVEFTARTDSGARLHTNLLLEELAAAADVTLLVVGPTPPAQVDYTLAERWYRVDNGRQLGRALEFGVAFIRGQHVVLHRSLRQGAANALAHAAGEIRPDAVVLQRPLYGPLIDVARRFAPTIVDADEATSKVMRLIALQPPSQSARARALMEWLVYRRLEPSLARADEVWVSSDVEARALRRIADGIRTRIVPNVIESSTFESVRSRPLGSSGAAYLGPYDYPPNAEAANWIIRELAPAFGERGLGVIDLIGRQPTRRMRRLASRQANIRILGETDDPWVLVRATGTLIVPLRAGAGTRWKVLEAAASEVPIVSTRFGVQGLELRPGVHYLAAESATQFTDAVERLKADPGLRRHVTGEARRLVETKYTRSVALAAVSAAVSALGPRVLA